MRDRRQVLQLIRDERGGIGFNLLWVCFVLLFMIPFFWDVASVHYARRFAGTGSDAASLAAAQEYARQLHFVPIWNGIFYGRCELGEYTPQQVVLRYLTNPAFGAPAGIGEPYARQYALENRNTLTTYRAWPDYTLAKPVAGIPIPAIKVYVEAKREVFTAYAPLYRREFEAPNRALAVAYLDTWRMTPRPCGSYYTTYDFTYEWKITLDKAR